MDMTVTGSVDIIISYQIIRPHHNIRTKKQTIANSFRKYLGALWDSV